MAGSPGGPGKWSQGGAQHVQRAIEKMTEKSGGNGAELAQSVVRSLSSQLGAFHIGQELSPHSPAVHVRRGNAEVRVERVGETFKIRRVLPGAPPPEEVLTEKLPSNASSGQINKHAGKDRRVATPWGPMQFYAGDDAGPYATLPDDKVVAGADADELVAKVAAEFKRLEVER